LAALAFVLGGLAFGARVAFATGPAAACPFDPPTLLGTCVNQQDCQNKCDQYNPPAGSTFGACTGGGCCVCLE